MHDAPILLLIGLDHHTTPVAVRERAHLSGQSQHSLLRRLIDHPDISEAFVLSTCNRVEVLMAVTDPKAASRHLLHSLSDLSGIQPQTLSRHMYVHCQYNAALHVMRVAAGLESLMLGETQILGQLASALRSAQQVSTIGSLLNQTIQAALHIGKRARAETDIAHGARSVASAAARLALRVTSHHHCPTILVIGAGEMGQAAARSLVGRGARVILTNRTDARANEHAARIGIEAHPWDALWDALPHADAVLVAVGGTHPLLTAERLSAQTRRHPLTLIDLSVPRMVEPNAADLPHITLYDIDTLHHAIDSANAARHLGAQRAGSLCVSAADSLMYRLNERRAIPIIKALYQQAEADIQARLAEAFQHQPDLDEQQRRNLERRVRRLTRKTLHPQIIALKARAASPQWENTPHV
jgi:glutamyl-tRNA reductase